jgi:hypothetical protein
MSNMNRFNSSVIILSLVALCGAGCANLPGDKGSQGAVIGGVSGAAVGAAVGGKHRVLGAIIGGAVGAGGGYVIGANSDKITGKDRNSAEQAAKKSQENPATAQDALRATTADVNNDGFVTLDEVVALKQAGLTDQQMLERMRATDQVFELTEDQRKYLTDRGVSRSVVNQMESINQEKRDRLLNEQRDVISRDTNARSR